MMDLTGDGARDEPKDTPGDEHPSIKWKESGDASWDGLKVITIEHFTRLDLEFMSVKQNEHGDTWWPKDIDSDPHALPASVAFQFFLFFISTGAVQP